MTTRCLFGDSTPFPLGERFLETLQALTTTCVDLLRVAHMLQAAEERIGATSRSAADDQAWLGRLGEVVEAAVRAHPPAGASNLARQQAQRVAEATQRILESAGQLITSHRDGTLRELEQAIGAQRQRAQESLEQFLLHHALPETIWGISWRAGGDQAATADAVAMAPCGIEASFRLYIPDEHRWAAPVKIGDLLGDLTLRLPLKGGKLRRQKLAKLLITAVDLAPSRLSMTLLRKRRDPSRGFEVELAGDGPPTIRALHEKDGLPAFSLEADDAGAVRQLADVMRRELRPLIGRRVAVGPVTLAGVHGAMEIPGEVAQVMIDAVAPFVREIVKRGPARGELSLKRDLGDGRREELFLPVARLTDRIALLPGERRGCFDPFGLPPRPAADDGGDHDGEAPTAPETGDPTAKDAA